ncbi:MAG: hypothetical protein FVQ80_14080 [Planctomycetes bacterium]|nr:hypothetical protein [Planctomycetota bacterium]
MTIFEQARQAITRPLIEAMYGTPGAYWKGDDYWTLSPLRGDKKIGSFSVNTEGNYFDFSSQDKGNFIDLVSKSSGCSPEEAAKEILGQDSVVPDEKPKTEKYKKPKPVIPIPPEALRKLNGTTKSDYARKKHGTPAGGWKYHMAEGEVCFCVVRYERPGKKEIIPYYYGEDSKFHEGQALKTGRPLYRLHELVKSDLPVLVVEGERCADIKVPGYILTTWAGGSRAVDKTDWNPLQNRDVTIWPDFDGPGLKAALCIWRIFL